MAVGLDGSRVFLSMDYALLRTLSWNVGARRGVETANRENSEHRRNGSARTLHETAHDASV